MEKWGYLNGLKRDAARSIYSHVLVMGARGYALPRIFFKMMKFGAF